MNERGGNDDTGTKLLCGHKDDASLRHTCEASEEHGCKDAQTTCHEDDKEQSYPEGLVVFAIYTLAGRLCFRCAASTVSARLSSVHEMVVSRRRKNTYGTPACSWQC